MMADELDEIVAQQMGFEQGFEEVWNLLQAESDDEHFGKLSVAGRKALAETALAIQDLLAFGLDQSEVDFAKHWQRWLIHTLRREYLGNATLFAYYFGTNYASNGEATTHTAISYLVSLRAMERCGGGLPRDGTAWKYFTRDLPKFREAVDAALQQEAPETRTNLLFLVLNAIDTLHAANEKGVVASELIEFRRLAERHANEFSATVGLQVYTSDLRERVNLSLEPEELPEGARWKGGAFLALLRLRRGQEIEIPSDPDDATPPHLWWLAQAWQSRRKGKALVGFVPFFHRINIDAVAEMVWGSMHELLNDVKLEQEEIEAVLALDAKGVKQAAHDYFVKHSQVTAQSRARLKAELEKADATSEISDFNVEIGTFRKKLWVALPIKSGLESKGTSRKKLEEKYLYQFIRPLIHFGPSSVAVFPILLVQPTLNTNEMLSLIRAHLDLPIFVVDTDLFTRILKKHGLLPVKK